MKLQLLIEIDKLPGMQGTFAERKNMFGISIQLLQVLNFQQYFACISVFVCLFFWWVKSQSMELMH